MDVVAHGLWGGALFYRQGRKQFLVGGLLGMAPDLLSFGVFHLTQPGWLAERLLGNISGPPALASLPPYVFHSYNVTHSMIVWTAGLWIAVGADQETSMAPHCLAAAYRLRYSHPCREVFPHAISVAFADTLRRRRPVVNALAHGGQLRRYVLRLLLACLAFPQKRQLN